MELSYEMTIEADKQLFQRFVTTSRSYPLYSQNSFLIEQIIVDNGAFFCNHQQLIDVSGDST